MAKKVNKKKRFNGTWLETHMDNKKKAMKKKRTELQIKKYKQGEIK